MARAGLTVTFWPREERTNRVKGLQTGLSSNLLTASHLRQVLSAFHPRPQRPLRGAGSTAAALVLRSPLLRRGQKEGRRPVFKQPDAAKVCAKAGHQLCFLWPMKGGGALLGMSDC